MELYPKDFYMAIIKLLFAKKVISPDEYFSIKKSAEFSPTGAGFIEAIENVFKNS